MLRARALRLLTLTFAIGSLACASPPGASMSQSRMENLIETASTSFEGEGDVVEFVFAGVRMVCISDVTHDRMRLVAPIANHDESTEIYIDAMLIANYHTALDARYGVSDGVIFAAFLHPLSSLTEAELTSALRQVASLARSFGSGFSSGELTFGAQ